MDAIKKNWKVKLLSLTIAIFLWSYIMSTTNPKVNVRLTNIPIIYENTDYLENNDLMVSPKTKKTVDITVSGQRSTIVNITPQHARVTADFQSLDEGVHTVALKYSLPEGVTLVDYDKDMTVTIDKVINKEMPVEVYNIGDLEEGLLIQSRLINPEKISIKGSRALIDQVDKLLVDLDLNNLTNNISVNRKIRAVDEKGQEVTGLTFGQEFVNLNVQVEMQKEVEIEAKVKGQLAGDYRLTDSNLNRDIAFVQGPADVIRNLTKIETQEINISSMTSSRTVPVKLDLLPNVRLVNPEFNYTVDLVIQEKVDKRFEIPSSNLKIENTEPKDFEIEEKTINIVLRNFSEELEKIEEGQIELQVDISNLSPGEHDIKPKVYINGELAEDSLIKEISNIKVVIK
ncbi:CdaR family protein [uncultured Helcococcus sp.]|uniref:CdaR family protein n=1 Tax=uncultured Helcococcus sp. TaxID=1072508 RepID=UPI00261B1072|nr:CdaR family protein [uncultured Helcococcus sp.]